MTVPVNSGSPSRCFRTCCPARGTQNVQLNFVFPRLRFVEICCANMIFSKAHIIQSSLLVFFCDFSFVTQKNKSRGTCRSSHIYQTQVSTTYKTSHFISNISEVHQEKKLKVHLKRNAQCSNDTVLIMSITTGLVQ